MSSNTLGTWAWAQQTHGRLSRRDQLTMARQGVLARLEALGPAARRGFVGGGAAPELPDPPDSRLARLAEECVRELSTPELHGHCQRTWLFATLFAARDRTAHDAELLYLACILHDLGLTDAHDGKDPTALCFGVEGARAAHTLLCSHGAEPERARTVAEAISLHLNVTVPEQLGAEASLLSKGVSLDVVGRRIWQLPPAPVAAVVERWPRAGSGAHLSEITRRQAARRPRSRAAFLHAAGFRGLIAANPLDA